MSRAGYRNYQVATTTPSGSTSDPILIYNNPSTVRVTPTGGASVLVQYTLSPPASVQAGTANWRNWPAGTVSIVAEDTIVGAFSAIRQTVTVAGSSTVEVDY